MTNWLEDFPWSTRRPPAKATQKDFGAIYQAPAQIEHLGIPVPFSQAVVSPEVLEMERLQREETARLQAETARLEAESRGLQIAAQRQDGSGQSQGLLPALAAFQDPVMRQKITDVGGTGSTVHGFEPASSPTPVPQNPQPGNLQSDFSAPPAQTIRPLSEPDLTYKPFDPPAPSSLPNYVRNRYDWQHPVNQQIQAIVNTHDTAIPPPPRPQVSVPNPMFQSWQSPFPTPQPLPGQVPLPINRPTATQMIRNLAGIR